MYAVEPPFPCRQSTTIASLLVSVQAIRYVSPRHGIACLTLGTTVSGTTSPVFHHGWTSVLGKKVVEDMYQVSNMNGTYYHCLASDICIELSCFLSTFLSTERSLASLPPLLPLRHLCYWASHSPVHHHAEDLLLSHNHRHEGSDSPIRIFHRRSPERYVPSVQHILFHARAPTMTCIILTYQPAVPLSVCL